MVTVVELNGGLGNQLFQTALACELRSRGHKVLLRADAIDPRRGLQVAGPAAALQLSFVRSQLASSRPIRVLKAERAIVEASPGFAPEVLGLSPRRNFRLRGYWQSERYFPTVSDLIRSRFLAAFERLLTSDGHRVLERARQPGTVSIHIRRGDYVTNPSAAATHGVLPLTYYDKALEQLGDPGRVLVFSDDLEWVRTAFAERGFEVVTPDLTSEAAGELALMAACSAHVVANSSFSWWGAWLGGREHDVIAPATWFATDEYDSQDIVPERWSRV